MTIEIERAWSAAEIKKPVPPFTLFWGRNRSKGSEILMILTAPMDIPYFQDHMTSRAAWEPLDIQDPEEWKAVFPAYVCWNLGNQQYEIITHNSLQSEDIIDFEPKKDVSDVSMWGHIPFDMATGQLRGLSALLVVANKMSRKPPTDIFWPSQAPK